MLMCSWMNSRGELIGIVDFKVSEYKDLGLAIPSNRVGDVIVDILDAHCQ